MQTTMNRRQWLASGALAAAAVALPRAPAAAANAPASGSLIKLDQNENPYGLSEKAAQAIADAVKSANRYPGRELAALRNLIAQREQVSGDSVVLGAGCTEILSLACLLYGGEGKEVLTAEPTYSGFSSYVERLGGTLVRVPVNDRWELDLDSMARRSTKSVSLVYVCNPNNPTSTMADAARLRAFGEDLARQSVVLVDEAYYELVEDAHRASMVELVRKGANVVVARTFSKLYGLAGLRVGYGIAKPEIAAQLRRVQTNFAPVNQLGLAAARTLYADAGFVASSRQRNAEARAGFYAVLEKCGHKAIAGSQTNFVTFEARGGAARLVSSLQRDYNIRVRSYEFLGKSWVRVSMGTPEEMSLLAKALQALA
jgi:histidinol-phosphate aminotransferase